MKPYKPKEIVSFIVFNEVSKSDENEIFDSLGVTKDTTFIFPHTQFDIFYDLEEITFTGKSVGFLLNSTRFYVSKLFIKTRPKWFQIYCEFWDMN